MAGNITLDQSLLCQIIGSDLLPIAQTRGMVERQSPWPTLGPKAQAKFSQKQSWLGYTPACPLDRYNILILDQLDRFSG